MLVPAPSQALAPTYECSLWRLCTLPFYSCRLGFPSPALPSCLWSHSLLLHTSAAVDWDLPSVTALLFLLFAHRTLSYAPGLLLTLSISIQVVLLSLCIVVLNYSSFLKFCLPSLIGSAATSSSTLLAWTLWRLPTPPFSSSYPATSSVSPTPSAAPAPSSFAFLARLFRAASSVTLGP